MEDVLKFNNDGNDHWHAQFEEIAFDIQKKDQNEFELNVEGRNLHESYVCSSFEEAKEKAMKFMVW